MTWTNELDLERWADTRESRVILPQLVRRLVNVTVDRINRIDFPAGEAGERHGWDGQLNAPEGNAFVPAGPSGWEMGAGKPREKAESDFKKRREEPLGLNPGKTTFVFVTPRKWEGKDAWCMEKKEEGPWKDVRVLDSSDLVQWLEIAPSVDTWFAQKIGRRPRGVLDPEEHWANLESLATPALSPEVFLTGRDEQVKAFEEWFGGPPSSLAIEARSPGEVVDFISAFLSKLDSESREALLSRFVFVEERDAWLALSASPGGLVLVAKPPLTLEADDVANAVRHGHKAILCVHRVLSGGQADLQLPQPHRINLYEALEASGFGREAASKLSRESGGNLTILKRLLARSAGADVPEWSKGQDAASLLPILLAGSWDDNCQADRDVLAQLANRPYKEVMDLASRWHVAGDSPVMRVGSCWSLASREDSWLLLSPHLTKQALDAFEDVAVDVLTENDPYYLLPQNERFMANIRGQVPSHSYNLRTGVAETLALLGGKSERGFPSDAISPAARAERVVRRILEGADWHRWASLSKVLPLIAESCPDALLDALEKDFGQDEPEVPELFDQESVSALGGSGPHTGLLWALENMAWNPELLSGAALGLARLARIDPAEVNPKGRLGNRPRRSLRTIFLSWYPQTTATVDERIKVLNLLARRVPDVAWRLILDLLPKSRDTSDELHHPQWRDWDKDWVKGSTNADRWKQVEFCANFLVSNVGSDTERLAQLVDSLERLPEDAGNRFLELLQRFRVDELSTEERRKLTELLREKVGQHRRHSEANWTLPDELLARLDGIIERFLPDDIVARNAWKFGPQWSVIERLGLKNGSWGKDEGVVFETRQQALQQIVKAEGFNGVLRLVEMADDAWGCGFTLGKENLLSSDKDVLPDLLSSAQKNEKDLAAGYSRGRFADSGWDWVDKQGLSGWSPEQAGELLLVLPFERRTWDYVERLGVNVISHYWHHVDQLYHGPEVADEEYAIDMLLQNDRPLHAAEVLAMFLHSHADLVKPALILKTLEGGLKAPSKEARREIPRQGVRYHLQKLFEKLQSDSGVDKQRLATLEIAYLGLFDGHRGADPKALQSILQDDPSFFTQLISLIYLPHNREGETPEPVDEATKNRAETAYRLLRSWKSLPGTQEDGSIDGECLLNWVKKARSLCEEADRLEACDATIGELLAHAPEESDGSWPCTAVREVIEEADSEKLQKGFETGVINNRGVVTKALNDGGSQERELARKYAGLAKSCAMEFPKTAACLRRLAKSYESDAKREDERSHEKF